MSKPYFENLSLKYSVRPCDGDAPASLFVEERAGQAYAVAMCPRYGEDDFKENARRMIACWEYFKGVETDEIERRVVLKGMLK